MKFRLLFSMVLLFAQNTFGQKDSIDAFCRMADTSLKSDNIILHSVQHKAFYEDALHIDHYYIDTVSSKLVKSIYEFKFEGDGETLEFYYNGGEILRIYAKHKFGERKFTGTFYFKSDSLLTHIGGEDSSGQIVFDLKNLLKTGNEHLSNSLKFFHKLKEDKN